MKRSGFKVQRPPGSRPPRVAKQIGPEYTLRPRSIAAAADALAPRAPVLKFAYVEDERFQSMCRGMACQHCGWAGPDAGVTWAHSNQGVHGKGLSQKASDEFVAALCWVCHGWLDQGGSASEAEKVAMWSASYHATVATAVRDGTWPAGRPVPVFEDDEVMA